MPTAAFAAIMFADIAGYTAMMQADEANGLSASGTFAKCWKSGNHQGKILQHYGDGSLVLFDSAVEAVASAKEIQLTLLEGTEGAPRIGIHIGDIVTEGNIFMAMASTWLPVESGHSGLRSDHGRNHSRPAQPPAVPACFPGQVRF